MKIDTLFMDYDKYLITIDEVPIGCDPISIGEVIVIKSWLRKNTDRLQAFFRAKDWWEDYLESKLRDETRGNAG